MILIIISFLESALLAAGHSVLQASTDADTLIAKTALAIAKERDVLVIAEDCDILVLVIHHFEKVMCNIKFVKFSKTTKAGTVYSVWNITETLSPQIRKNILFIHAWGGCDTTSATFSHGKLAVLKLAQKQSLNKYTNIFLSHGQNAESIGATGTDFLSRMYGSEKTPKAAEI